MSSAGFGGTEDTFGPYRLIRRLAFGGMAEIFLAAMSRDGGFEKRVVVKRILPQFGVDPGFVQMFIDEAVVAGRLTHPNLVQVYDFGNVEGVYYMALEYVDGADLRTVMKRCDEARRPLSFVEVAALGEAVARGLAYAHAFTDEQLGPLHIVHRDVSPHNIMISRGGDVKVMDFGIAKAAARATRTATGTLKGKMAYMAPEQAGGRDVDARCDQFALGVVLWECLSGRRLFEAGSDLELLKRVMDCDVPRLADVRSDVPPELEGAVMRCLSRERDDRFAKLTELEAALRDFRWSLGPKGAVQLGELVEVAAPAPTQPASRRTQPLPAVARRTQPLPSSEGGDPAATPGDDWTTPDASLEPSDLARERTTAPIGGPPRVRVQTLSLSPSESDRPPADDRLPAVEGPAPAEAPGREAAGDSSAAPSRRRPVLRGLVAAGLGAVLAAAGLAGSLRLRGHPSAETHAMAPAVQGVVRPPPSGSRLRVESEPPGASLFEDGLDTGLTTPVEVPAPKAGGSFLLELRLPGRRVWQWPVTAGDEGKVLRASLEPEGATQGITIPAGAAAPAAAAAEPRARAVSPPPARRSTRADEPRAPAPPAASRALATVAPAPPGFLSLRSSGAWVDVYLGRRKLGTTPLVHAEVPSGRVRLRLVNSLAGIERTLEVDVAPDKEVRQTFNPDVP